MSTNEFTKLYSPPFYLTNTGTLANNDEKTLAWLNTNFNKGRAFNRSNRAWKIADACMSILYGDDNTKIPAGISKVQFKKLRRQLREMIANATNIRPRFEIQTFKNAYQDEALIYSKLNKHWWINEFIDRKVKAVGQWAGGAGTGFLFLWPETDPNTNKEEIRTYVLSHKDIFLFHASGSNVDLDKLYGVSVRLEMSVPEAHERFPEKIAVIKQDRSVPSNMAKIAKDTYRAYKGLYDRLKNRGNNKQDIDNPYPTCDIYYTFIRDNSINETGADIIMGGESESGIFNSKWAYKVPSYFNNDGSRSIYSRKECKLFPNRRLIISCTNGIIYDGPPNYICRSVPIADFRFDEIVGEFFGIPPANDARALEEASNELARASVDAVTGRVQPPMMIDNAVPKPLALKFAANPRTLQGKVFRGDTRNVGSAIKPVIGAEYYTVDGKALELIALFQQSADYAVGTHDNTALAQLGQMPAADTQDSMIRMLGSIALDHSRSFEYSLWRVGKIWLDFAPQVYTTEQRLMFLGADGVTLDTWDYDPNSLIPKTEINNNEPLWKRLLSHLNKFSLYIAPNSLQERYSQTNKLTILQLKKMGLPISDKRVYETFFDDNKYATMLEEYNTEMETKIKQAAKLNKEMQEAQAASTAGNVAFDAIKNIMSNQNSNEGRPSSLAKPPTLEAKSDENGVPRTTLASS